MDQPAAIIDPILTPHDDAYADRVRASFARMGLMAHLGAELGTVAPGRVEILVPFRPELAQQHGFFHAGTASSIADTAGGYAAYTLYPPDASVLAVEFKINLLAPGDGDRMRAVARVLKPGRTLTVCEIDVFTRKNGVEKRTAKVQQTLICLIDRPGIARG